MEALKKITINFADGSSKEVARGTSLLDLSKKYQAKYYSSIIAAKVNNDIKELDFCLENDCKVEFIDLTTDDGMRIYRRTLIFILAKAVNDVFPDRKVVINHSAGTGLYCEIFGERELSADDVKRIKTRMQEIIDMHMAFEKVIIPVEDAREVLREKNKIDKLRLMEDRQNTHAILYRCDGFEEYFYGHMAPHTGYIHLFDLIHYPPGLILLYPEKTNPNVLPVFKELKKLFAIFSENREWGRILGVESVSSINDIVKENRIGELIRISEALHEKKIAEIADMITESNKLKKIVLIAGPSSSGKTTFSSRLAIQLRVNGVRPIIIGMDDYFVDRDKTPLDENGQQDFEALEAVDLELFNEHLARMLNGIEVKVPSYNFNLGKREYTGRKIRMEEDQVLIIEGIHALNEKVTSSVPRENKFKIYISAITSLNIDDHNRVPTTDTRLIRRIVRDHKFRGSTAVETIRRWPSVRRGEERNIFPFQEEADVMFNSSLKYEHGVLKIFAEPLLAKIDDSYPEYSEAKRLREFLSYFIPIADIHEIPDNSILREFIGGSCF
ncbi:MAG: nucleoside kinase [Clostridiaceae bacterium]|nr:nucleoside kinase [Clostridiaceae bacterium]